MQICTAQPAPQPSQLHMHVLLCAAISTMVSVAEILKKDKLADEKRESSWELRHVWLLSVLQSGIEHALSHETPSPVPLQSCPHTWTPPLRMAVPSPTWRF